MPRLDDLSHQLRLLEDQGLLRVPDDGRTRQQLRERWGEEFIDVTSNDYLGLGLGLRAGPDSVSRETSSPASSKETPPPAPPVSRETPLGAGSSRLVYGTDPRHLEVEAVAADWLRQPAALLFASGYAANMGALGALLDKEDLVVSDALNHASLIDGIRLSRARVAVTPHLDLEAVRVALAQPTAGARWVVVESYYSMDGDSPDLAALRALCDSVGAYLYVDEAHAWGALGPAGGGLLAEARVAADVVMGAFGKAVGSHGAALASSAEVRTWLWNRARSFVFSTAPSPQHCRDLLAQLLRARGAEPAREKLSQHSARLRAALRAGGLPLATSNHGPIVSLVLGTPERALAVAQALAERGILVQAIRPPTVPEGQSRLRLTLSAAHSSEQLDRLAQGLLGAWESLG